MGTVIGNPGPGPACCDSSSLTCADFVSEFIDIVESLPSVINGTVVGGCFDGLTFNLPTRGTTNTGDAKQIRWENTAYPSAGITAPPGWICEEWFNYIIITNAIRYSGIRAGSEWQCSATLPWLEMNTRSTTPVYCSVLLRPIITPLNPPAIPPINNGLADAVLQAINNSPFYLEWPYASFLTQFSPGCPSDIVDCLDQCTWCTTEEMGVMCAGPMGPEPCLQFVCQDSVKIVFTE